jgi:endonuclease YncB( thermonuclease family)
LLVLLVTLQACAHDHGSADDPKTGYLYGSVIRIADGDTLTILSPVKKQVKIRLAEIDTPERGQPFGTWAKNQLSDMVFQKDIAIKQVDIDRYDRIVGRVYVGELDVNAELVRIGAAWVYRKYAKDASLYDLEEEARMAKRGLWSQAPQISPWEWRKR